jgi:hypothetical protein
MDNIEQIGDNYLEKEEWDLLRKTYGFYSRLGRERCWERDLSNLSDAVV